MKKTIALMTLITVVVGVILASHKGQTDTRDYAYEAYCDSIYDADPDYYLDVLEESDEYTSYIETYGEWWK